MLRKGIKKERRAISFPWQSEAELAKQWSLQKDDVAMQLRVKTTATFFTVEEVLFILSYCLVTDGSESDKTA